MSGAWSMITTRQCGSVTTRRILHAVFASMVRPVTVVNFRVERADPAFTSRLDLTATDTAFDSVSRAIQTGRETEQTARRTFTCPP